MKAGIGQFLDEYRDAVRGALKNDLLTESDIDRALRGVFRVMIKLGLLDPPARVPYAAIGSEPDDPWLSAKHKAIARLATQKSIVLLKTPPGFYRSTKKRLKSIAVIGPRGNEVLLDWYSGTPPYRSTPLEGIKIRVGQTSMCNSPQTTITMQAMKLARESDVAIVCVGNHPNGGFDDVWAKVSVPSEGREAVDRQSITLEQEELIKQVFEANPKTIVVLISSFPYAINWTQQNVPAILHMAQNSQEEGNALADVLFGDYNPAGRLVQTWPKSIEQLPPMIDYDIRHGRTYMYFKGEPLYPFGYGLSYTTFAYGGLRISPASLSTDGTVNVSFDLRNTGKRVGEEVVQLYVKHLESKVARPIEELKGFKRVEVKPGRTQQVSLVLKADQLGYWDDSKHGFVVEPGKIQILIGPSSAEMKLSATVTLTK